MIKIGDPVPRFEDRRLVTGHGSYTDDALAESDACMVLVRSPVAAAKIKSVDVQEAKLAPGVLGVFTSDDLDADDIGYFSTGFPFKRPDGSEMYQPRFGLLAKGVVRFVGDPVVVVIAETRAQAEDAAEVVAVNYDDEAAVTDAKIALSDGSPTLWPDAPGNLAFVVERGDKAATENAFVKAAHVTALELRITRVTANPIEPRAAIGSFDAHTTRYTLRCGTQTPQRMRDMLASDILKISADHIHVVTPDVGGAFGMKNSPYAEYGLVLWAAKRTGRTVAWRASRIESMQSDYQGRDNYICAELAIDADGIFSAIRVKSIGNLGAYLGPLTPHPPTANVGGMIGPYGIGAAHIEITGAHTNTPPTAPYRGAGRPEATYVIERLVDATAIDLDIDPIELRRRNMLKPDQLPHLTPLGMHYDSGDFPEVLSKCVAIADWAGFEKRRAQSACHGLLRGRGLAYSIEIAGGPQGAHQSETADIRFTDDGDVTVLMGSKEMGTGHATAYRQILSDHLRLDPHRITVIDGDTDTIPTGTGSFGSRTMIAGGTALVRATEAIIETGKLLAAEALEAAEIDIEFSTGAFRVVGTDRAISLHDLGKRASDKLNIAVTEKADGPTYPNGCHICEVVIDPDTGVTTLERYVLVDDVGTVINPMIVKGQLQGGIAQGAGQVLMEQIVFDPAGQLITGSFLDYAMPRADDMPLFDIQTHAVPTHRNPLGVKGSGEAGTVGALPVLIIATLDALRPLGVTHIDMPLTAERVWQAIKEAKQ
ncbi:MAG: xanthine dehydrogenase family protein molybdopterin-binding subunit [Rhodospirillaceae bacterium]|nr:xanthine dehydrogenase family protein molybdopterin-binding subunit [Rhodospirillaceae bacterium]